MEKEKIIEIAKQIRGSLSIGDMSVIYDYVVKSNPGLIVEIGCYYGKSSYIISKAKRDSVFYTIDSFTGTEIDHNSEQYRIMIENMVKFDFFPRIIHSDSKRASGVFKDKSIDLLFIDGWHSEEYVTSDIKNFLPKMKDRSIMFGHDWDNYDDVRNSVLKFFDMENICTHRIDGSSIWSVRI